MSETSKTPRPTRLGTFVTRYATDHPGEPLEYVIERDGRRFTLPIVPQIVREGGVTKTAARAIGVMQAAYEAAAAYAADRKVFGKTIGDYRELTQAKLARWRC